MTAGGLYPLLPVAVLQVVVGAVVPVQPDTDEMPRQKTVFSHDDKIGEEAPKSLDHSFRNKVLTGLSDKTHWTEQNDQHVCKLKSQRLQGTRLMKPAERKQEVHQPICP